MEENNFYTRHEEYGDKFYRVPKVFTTHPLYTKLSNDAKMAWAILRDRHELSIRNGWFDESGRIFFIYSNEKLIEILGLSKNTVTKVKKELKKAKLLHPERQGQGKPDKLYLLKPVLRDEDIYLIRQKENEMESPEGKEKKENSQNPKNGDSAQTVGGVEKHKNWDSKIPKMGILKSQNLTPNDTEVRNTDFRETDLKDQKEGQRVDSPPINFSEIDRQIAEDTYRDLKLRKYDLPLSLINWLSEEIRIKGAFRNDFDLLEVEALYQKYKGIIDNEHADSSDVLSEVEFSQSVLALYKNGMPVKYSFKKQLESWFYRKFDFKEADFLLEIEKRNELNGVPY